MKQMIDYKVFLHNLRLQNKIYLNSLNQSAKNYELIQKRDYPFKSKNSKEFRKL